MRCRARCLGLFYADGGSFFMARLSTTWATQDQSAGFLPTQEVEIRVFDPDAMKVGRIYEITLTEVAE